jgi:hypothetical protein
MRRRFRRRWNKPKPSYLYPISSDACLRDIQNSTRYHPYIGLPGLFSYPTFTLFSIVFAVISISAVSHYDL